MTYVLFQQLYTFYIVSQYYVYYTVLAPLARDYNEGWAHLISVHTYRNASAQVNVERT